MLFQDSIIREKRDQSNIKRKKHIQNHFLSKQNYFFVNLNKKDVLCEPESTLFVQLCLIKKANSAAGVLEPGKIISFF